jgi:hypothetical protein
MFEKLESVMWEQYATAHGDARHIPEAIRSLVSEDESVRNAAYWQIDNHVVLQSDLYEAAPYVVPFLLEILAGRFRSGRDRLYDLLWEIANGKAPVEVQSDIAGSNHPMALEKACRMEVLKGMETYLKDAADPDPLVRKKATDLISSLTLATFVEKLIQHVPELKTIYDQHVFENGTLLPHVLFGDIARFVIAKAHERKSSSSLDRLLEHLENGLRNGSKEVKELIKASLVENLIGEDSTIKALQPMMGAFLRKEVKAICGR